MARLNKWERQHLKDLSALDKRIEQIYEAAVKEAARIGATISDFNPDRLFFFQRLSNYTQKNRKAVVGAEKVTLRRLLSTGLRRLGRFQTTRTENSPVRSSGTI